MIEKRYLTLFFACFAMLSSELVAQNGSFIPLDHWSYHSIERLQRRGLLLELSPTNLPYTYGELRNAVDELEDLDNKKHQTWIDELKVYLSENDRSAGLYLESALSALNSERKDLLRPKSTDSQVLSMVHARAFFENSGVIAQMGGRHDLFYDEDPDGLDAGNRLIARNDESYLGYQKSGNNSFRIYLGRFKNHWGRLGETALLISDNPHAYDQLNIKFSYNNFSFTSIYGELDSWSTRLGYTGRAGNRGSGESETPIRRYISAHRLDWRPSKYFAITFMESALISGPNAGLSLRYLNPLSNFVLMVDNSPKNEENNGLIAGILWMQKNNLTVHGQLLIDDLDLKFGDEPGSVALTGSAIYAGSSFADLGLRLDIVSGRSYNSEQAEGQYLYLLRGLATQFSDYIQLGGYAEFFPTMLKGGYLRASLDYLKRGNQEIIARAYPDDDVDFILSEPTVSVLRPSLQVFFRPNSWSQIDLDLGLNYGRNLDPSEWSNGTMEDGNSLSLIGKLRLGVELPSSIWQ